MYSVPTYKYTRFDWSENLLEKLYIKDIKMYNINTAKIAGFKWISIVFSWVLISTYFISIMADIIIVIWLKSSHFTFELIVILLLQEIDWTYSTIHCKIKLK